MIKTVLNLEREGNEYVAYLRLHNNGNPYRTLAAISYPTKPTIRLNGLTCKRSLLIEIGNNAFWVDEFKSENNEISPLKPEKITSKKEVE